MARSEKQANASRKNGCKSKGPKSSQGKAKVAVNTTVHGLRSTSLLVPGESAEGWQAFNKDIVASLNPVGAFEVELASRIASLTWRLRRAATYEATSATTRREDTEEQLLAPILDTTPGATLVAQRRLAQLGKRADHLEGKQRLWASTLDLFGRISDLPDEAPLEGEAVLGALTDLTSDSIDEWVARLAEGTSTPAEAWYDPAGSRWTAGAFREGVAVLARASGVSPEVLLHAALVERAEVDDWMTEDLGKLRSQHASLLARRLAQAALPTTDMIELLCRYESHLSRELARTLELLRQVQAARQGK